MTDIPTIHDGDEHVAGYAVPDAVVSSPRDASTEEVEFLRNMVAALRRTGEIQYKAVQDMARLAHIAQDEVAEHEAVYAQMQDNIWKARAERNEAQAEATGLRVELVALRA